MSNFGTLLAYDLDEAIQKDLKFMKKQMINRVLDGAVVVALLVTLTQTASAFPPPIATAPDASSTTALMAVACAGLAIIRRLRR